MRIYKEGGHRLFESDRETAETVSAMLLDLEKNGMDAVRKYSRKFDNWDPANFELTPGEIKRTVDDLDEQIKKDTEFCQENVRRFAQAQLETMKPLETEPRAGIILGEQRHHHHSRLQGGGRPDKRRLRTGTSGTPR